MRDEQKKLCELIDNQDAAALEAFLTTHPALDLNNITPSGCSALWYALTPQKGKKSSLAIIQALINTGRINPTETYQNLRYNDLSLSSSIMQSIKTYEDQYQHPRLAQVEANNPDRLAQIAADSQNTHDPVVVKGVDDSVIRLLKRYNLNEKAINLQITALMDFIKAIKSKTEINIDLKILNDALTAIGRISKDNTTRDYQLAENQSKTLTNSTVLALMFCAASDNNANNFVPDADMSDVEVLERKLQLIKHLAKSQNEYGNNSVACWMGTRNQMVSSLDMTHVDIRIV